MLPEASFINFVVPKEKLLPERGHGFPEDRVLRVCMSAPSAPGRFHLRQADLLIAGWWRDGETMGEVFLAQNSFPSARSVAKARLRDGS